MRERERELNSQLKAGASDRERICSTAHLVGASERRERAQSRVTRRRVVRGVKPNVPKLSINKIKTAFVKLGVLASDRRETVLVWFV